MQANCEGSLIEKYVNSIYLKRYSARLMNKKDLLQEAWIVSSKCQKIYDPTYGLTYEQFERLCVYRHILKLVKVAESQQTSSLEDEIHEPSDSGIPIDVLCDIKHLVDRLSAHEQTIMRYRYQEGLKFREIGEKMGVTKQAAQMAHANIMKKMRRWLNA